MVYMVQKEGRKMEIKNMFPRSLMPEIEVERGDLINISLNNLSYAEVLQIAEFIKNAGIR